MNSLKNYQLHLTYNNQTHVFGSGDKLIQLSCNKSTICQSKDFCEWAQSYIYGEWSTQDLSHLLEAFSTAEFWTTSFRSQLLTFVNKILPLDWKKSLSFYQGHLDASIGRFNNQLLTLALPALYQHPHASLSEAQTWFLMRTCEKLDLTPDMTFLDFGSSLGALGRYAARHYGVSVKIVYFCLEEKELIERYYHNEHYSKLIELVFIDDVFLKEGVFDRIAVQSPFDMIGHYHLPNFIKKFMSKLDKKGLLFLNTTVTCLPNHVIYQEFMQKYFNSAFVLYSLPELLNQIDSCVKVELANAECINEHVVRSLKDFQKEIELSDVAGDLTSARLIKLIVMRLSLMQALYKKRSLQSLQLLLAHPGYQRSDWLLAYNRSSLFPSPTL